MKQLVISPKKLSVVLTASKIGIITIETSIEYLRGRKISGSAIMSIKLAKSALRISKEKCDKLALKSKGTVLAKYKELKKLSKIQRLYYKRLSDRSKVAYMNTFAGVQQDFNFRRDYGFTRPKLKPTKTQEFLKNLYSVTCSKVPPKNKDLGQYIGVEIECFIPQESILGLTNPVYSACEYCDGGILENGDQCDECNGTGEILGESLDNSKSKLDLLREYFENKKIKNINVKSDGSIEPSKGHIPAEFTILYRRDDASNLKTLCDTLNKLGAKVNKSCGMHVHLDMRDASEYILSTRARRLGHALNALAQVVPQSRLDNHFCKLGVSKLNGSRYFAINKTAFRKYTTLEVRLHSATTDYFKIVTWSELLYATSRSKHLTNNIVPSIDELCSVLKVSDTITEHFLKRAALFSKPTNEEVA